MLIRTSVAVDHLNLELMKVRFLEQQELQFREAIAARASRTRAIQLPGDEITSCCWEPEPFRTVHYKWLTSASGKPKVSLEELGTLLALVSR